MLRVLIIENNLLVGAVVQVLLANVVGLELTGASPQSSLDMIKTIDQVKPNVVILDESSRFVIPLKLLILFRLTYQMRVIIVSANSDVVRIYGKQDILVTDSTQFVDIVCLLEAPSGFLDEKGAPAGNIGV